MLKALASIVVAPIAFTIIIALRILAGITHLLRDIVTLIGIFFTILTEIIHRTRQSLAEQEASRSAQHHSETMELIQNVAQ